MENPTQARLPHGKRQQTISSFFAPSPPSSASQKASARRPLAPPPSAPKIAAPAGHRSPSVTADVESDDLSDGPVTPAEGPSLAKGRLPSNKRRKVSEEPGGWSEGVPLDTLHDVSRPRASLQPRESPVVGAPATDRTSRFLFDAPGGAQQQSIADDDETRRLKSALHAKFVKRLGDSNRSLDMRRRSGGIEDDPEPDGEDDAEDDGLDDDPPPKTTARGKRKSSGHTLTPMEKQVIEIKRAHRDTVLVVEVGYKYRFFGEDARVAAKELGIVCIPGKMDIDEHFGPHEDRFASASIPTHRLHVHVRRLVGAGLKVGVVRQVETAALKAAGSNRNAPFTRKLTNLYTKGTYIDDGESLIESPSGPSASGAPGTGHMLCLTETNAKGWGSDEKVRFGIVAVQPCTGDVIYDDFEDGFLRGEIETRLLHIAPCEILIVGELSTATARLIKHLSGSKINVFGDKVRVERADKPRAAAAQSYGHISTFYAEKLKSTDVSNETARGTILDKVHQLSEHTSICLSAMITHLTAFGLEHVFDLTKNFQAFNARSHMLLNGNTLTSLEIYRNQTNHSEKGSLFWVLDQTLSRFGQRLLRKWVGRPLLDRVKLQERIDAVEELNQTEKSTHVEKLRSLLAKTKGDLEKSLIRIYYGKCTRPELLTVLQTLQRIATEYAHVKSAAEAGFSSPLLNDAVSSLPLILDDVLSYLDMINPEAAKENDKETFFRDEHATERMTDHKAGLDAVEGDLDAHRSEAAAKLKKKSVEYVTVAGIDYLIEVENGKLKTVPASWAKISGTKKVSRFHTPEVVRMIRERDQQREALAAACDDAFKELLADIAGNYQTFRDCVQSLATLDCLLSLATVAARPDYCKPSFTDTTQITVEAGRHPMVEQLLLTSYVANDVSLSTDSTHALLITGPNMGGKSSYVRQVALISVMGQIGSYVPAASARLGMLDAIFTRMGAFDNMLAGESTFMVELNETSAMLKQAGPRSLVILDELGRGTSTHDGVAIAHAVLDYMVRQTRGLLLFITHYQSLSSVADGFENGELKNVHMRFSETKGAEGEDEVTFLYELGEGTAHRSYGLNVARLANVPREVLEVAREKSAELEARVRAAGVSSAARALSKAVLLGEEADLAGLASCVEEL